MKLTLIQIFILIVVSFSTKNKEKKNKSINLKKTHPHKKVARKVDSDLPYDRSSIPGSVSGSAEYLESPMEDEIMPKVSAPVTKKRRDQSSDGGGSSNSMLQLEASNNFETAIENDINELNNPTDVEFSKRSNIETRSPLETSHEVHETVVTPALNDTGNTMITAGSSKGNTTLPFYLDGNKTNLTEVYELISRTSRLYSQYILDEMTLVAKSQEDKTPIKCDQSPSSNCSSASNITTERPIDKIKLNKTDIYDKFCSGWSDWSQCTDSCKNGIAFRSRDCYHGNGEKSQENETKPCSIPACLYCSEWSRFSSCSKICGIGIKTKIRLCNLNNGSRLEDKIDEPCNMHPCSTECEPWSSWSNCSKPCDSGVSIRVRNCTLPDTAIKTFYEHRVCNTQACNQTDTNQTVPIQNISDIDNSDNQNCLSAYLSFEKYQDSVSTIYDESEEHNDAEGKKISFFDGNYTCGYSASFTQPESVIQLYDDLFRNFEKSEISVMFWIYLSSKQPQRNKIRSIFYLSSRYYKYGEYSLEVLQDNRLSWTVKTNGNSSIINGQTIIGLKPDTWYHVYAHYGGDEQDVELFINARKSKLSIKKVGNIAPYHSIENMNELNTLQFQGFGNSPQLDKPFTGLLDEIYIFKCGLNQKEIEGFANTCRYRAGLGCSSPLQGICPNCPPCKPNWENDKITPLPHAPTPLYYV